MVMPEDPSLLAPPPSESDGPFRRMITLSTASSLGVAYGWLAGFVRQSNGDLTFQWRWPVLLWAVIGLGSTIYFWRKIWPPADRPDATRKDIVEGSVALALPGVWWLLFPLRSLSGQHFWQVVEGLSIAAVVLTFGALMVIRLGRAFEEDK
jgi:hypothetical protein